MRLFSKSSLFYERCESLFFTCFWMAQLKDACFQLQGEQQMDPANETYWPVRVKPLSSSGQLRAVSRMHSAFQPAVCQENALGVTLSQRTVCHQPTIVEVICLECPQFVGIKCQDSLTVRYHQCDISSDPQKESFWNLPHFPDNM